MNRVSIVRNPCTDGTSAPPSPYQGRFCGQSAEQGPPAESTRSRNRTLSRTGYARCDLNRSGMTIGSVAGTAATQQSQCLPHRARSRLFEADREPDRCLSAPGIRRVPSVKGESFGCLRRDTSHRPPFRTLRPAFALSRWSIETLNCRTPLDGFESHGLDQPCPERIR